MNRKPVFIGSLILSVLFHGAALVCIQKYSLWCSSSTSAEKTANWLSFVEKTERDTILQTAFQRIAPDDSGALPRREPDPEETSALSLKVAIQLCEPELLGTHRFEWNASMDQPLLDDSTTLVFSLPSQSFNLLEHLPKDLIVPVPGSPVHTVFSPSLASASIAILPKMPHISDLNPGQREIIYPNPRDAASIQPPQIQKPAFPIPAPDLPKLPTLADLETSSYSDSFDADLVFVPREDGHGYIFALTLIPRPDLDLPRLTQRITFLIDRSNSIQQGRLSAAKAAVHRALEELASEDTFNLIAFDHKVEKMAPNNLPCTGKAYAAAEEFLENIQLGSFFASGDLFKPLFLTVPGDVAADEVHTAILLTDGETLAKKPARRALFHDWTGYNSGKVSLFVFCMHDSHLPLLDAAAVLNRGKAINASTNRGLKRKLSKLIKTIQNPIAKNLVCHAIGKSNPSQIELFADPSQTPHLYLDQPYVILGQTQTLDDFILFVQGRLNGRWLNIKKTVSFLNARKGGKSLKQEFALQSAYRLYEQYIIDDNPKHIAEAQKLLEPYELRSVFQ